jgi:hypothetical protein
MAAEITRRSGVVVAVPDLFRIADAAEPTALGELPLTRRAVFDPIPVPEPLRSR